MKLSTVITAEIRFMTKYLVCIVGPTAIGKTALSLEVAHHFNTEIISCDSRQFYKEMSIGTAIPTKEELESITHHFIQHISIHDEYNVGQFEKNVIPTIEKLFLQKDVLVLVGGSGLYQRAVTHGLDEFPKIDPGIRETLNAQLEAEGLDFLKNKLKALDIDSYQQLDTGNPHRVIRALEVTIGSGKPYSSYLSNPAIERSFKILQIGLKADREELYNRINMRVDRMMDEGLYDEARALYPYRSLNALNTVGYKELFKVIEGEWDLEFAVSEIKKNTRRFAKRQLTWYRKNEDVIWFDFDLPYEDIIKRIELQIKKPT